MKQIKIDDRTVFVLEQILKARKGLSYDEVLDASVCLYLHALNCKMFSAAVVQGFYSAMAVIYNLDAGQFEVLMNQQLRKENE